MSTVIVDAAMREKLLAAGKVIEFRDETGALVARLVRPDWPAPPPGYEIVGEVPTIEELDRRVREDRRYSAAEVEEYLRKLREEHP